MKSINIFGVTGSIGKSTADVILAHADKFDVNVVSANSSAAELAEMAIRLDANIAVLAEDANYQTLRDLLDGTGITIACGRQALLEYSASKADISMMAIVGMAGLEPLMIALEHSSAVAIANKEPLVAAGPFVMKKAKECGTVILPVDSEHNAIFQVFDRDNRDSIERIILTASGGPFRTWALDKMKAASRADALAHPNWDMGAKISVDSATMMNKALEVIEAHYLFDMPSEKIDVIVHPQSIIHSMVEYCDGSVLAQMGASDMRTPIANILDYPKKLTTSGNRLNLKELSSLEFEGLDDKKFPFVGMAYASLKSGLYHSIALNASNEVAVAAFLDEKIGFYDIIYSVQSVLDSINSCDVRDLGDVISIDAQVRNQTKDIISQGVIRKTVSA